MCEENKVCFYLFAALYMIVNNYVKTCPFDILVARAKHIYANLGARTHKYVHSSLLCNVVYAYTISE